ncbi:MAG TPA: molybdate ABC transporter substrate-binding protein [Acidobacteriaceae bacterium]|nr:molybdate ABC transporter substrate-binding protein [Acidobacteriaceae bacterium]
MLLLFGCSFVAAQTTLRVAAAADLQPVLPPLVTQFEHATGMQVAVSYASSATLATQILNGAPFDVFLAADQSFPQRVIAGGLADETSPVVYARGTLVLWARNDPLHGPLTMLYMSDPAVKRIAVANPQHAPYGRAAIAALHGLKSFDTLQSKLVYAENIAQTAQFAESGNAQCGLISQTQAETATLRAVGTYIVVPATAYPAIEQGAIVLRHAPQHAAAQKFLQFVLSPDGQKLLAAGGLTRVQ